MTPTGTVTFLFTDIEGSTKLWEAHPASMRLALVRHDALVREAVGRMNGLVFKTVGDAFCTAFAAASDAAAAAWFAQRSLAAEPWPKEAPIKVRMALHTGAVENRDGDYFGPAVNRVARLLSTGHGGQTLLSQNTRDLLGDALPDTVSLRDLGSHQLKDLARPEQVYQMAHPSLPADFPPLRSLSTHPNNLPSQLTSFIGREKEIAQIGAMLAKSRLLTLTGAGGSGKTRLCLQVAADALVQFPEGAWLVELAALPDPDLVPQTVAAALSVKEETGRLITATLVEYVKAKRVLLLLDNCEHLLDACATLAESLLRHCPHVRILASSREALGIAGEQSYRVPSLSLPGPKHLLTPTTLAQYESAQLFVERARIARADFALTDENVHALASLCRHLDGIPLAIELAAARIRTLSVNEIDGRLNQRFRLLTGGSRTALPRQQTLRSLIDWSYDLLDEREKSLLQEVSVFAGGWTLTTAEQVCAQESDAGADVLDQLTSLVDKSLVLTEQESEHPRFHLLETVRQYAREKLAESGRGEVIRERHRDYFVALAEEAEPNLQGAEQGAWLRRLDDEHDNLRVAFDWSVESGSETSLQLCGALLLFWSTRGYLSEGRDWCARALAHTKLQSPSRTRAKTLNVAGALAYYEGDHAAARTAHEESLVIYEGLADQAGMAKALNNLGIDLMVAGDPASARKRHEESLAIKRHLGDRRGAALSLNNLGNVVLQLGDYPAAKAYCEESLSIAQALGDRGTAVAQLGNLAEISAVQGDYDNARRMHLARLAICRELGHVVWLPSSLIGLAEICGALGRPLCAARLWGVAQRLQDELGSPLSPNEQSRYNQHVTMARAAAGDGAAFDRAWQEGHTLDLDQAIQLAQQDPGEDR